ncbi:MAG: 3'-5' exonuclease [Flavobacteriales bacterium]|jgi:DNA polymerase elongation subunit (family B)|nr:3'-5' exonuclease [Flavobacteriales bacterium]
MKHINIQKLLYIDIETVSEYSRFDELDTEYQELFEKKTSYQRKDNFTAEEFYDRAGIWAEFGKIVCISIAYLSKKGGKRVLKLKSFFGHDEKNILQEFSEVISAFPFYSFCGHNIKEFDLPYLCRRYLINGLELPNSLQIAGKKPWEITHVDTMELWKFGDFKHFTSLKLLAKIFGIPSPKDDIDGSEVGRVYWEENDPKRIAIYCEKDVLTTAQLMLKWQGEALLEPHEVLFSLQ